MDANMSFSFAGEFGLRIAGQSTAGGNEFLSDDDDDGDNNFESGLEAMEKREQERTENMLLETEFKLFHEEHNYEKLLAAQRKKDLEAGGEEKFRYFSLGYGANVDQVDDLEVSRWQSRFPYFHVVGLGEEPRNSDILMADNTDCAQHFDEVEEIENYTDYSNLVITGTKSIIHVMHETAEEYFAEHGIVEEVIAIHSDPSLVDNTNRIIVEVEP